MFTYIMIDLLTLLGPLALSFEPRVRFFEKWKYLFPALIIAAVMFITWDYVFTLRGVWAFNPATVIGIYVFNLPLEEVLFFFFIPYACVFIYEVVLYIDGGEILRPVTLPLTLFLAAVLIIVGMLSLDKAYTPVVFMVTGIFLLVHLYALRAAYLAHFYFMYLISLLPFLFFGRVLAGGLPWTGHGPIVWYNSAEILNFRIMEVPIEDFVYSMLLLLTTVTLYEYFRIRGRRQ